MGERPEKIGISMSVGQKAQLKPRRATHFIKQDFAAVVADSLEYLLDLSDET